VIRLRRTQHQPGKDVKEDLKKISFTSFENIIQYNSLESNKFTDLGDTCQAKTVTFARPNDDQYK
jgi:hypothetical protein